jgi:hypothetical protein
MPDYAKLIDAPPWSIGGISDPDDPRVLAHLTRISDEVFRDPSVENPTMPAGYTYLAQFLNHDLSFPQPTAGGNRNARSPRLDLDSLYGGGPLAEPHLYEIENPARLALAYNDQGEPDLPRSTDTAARRGSGGHATDWRRAVIADPRNDENVLIAQLHLGLIRLHNRFVEECVGVATWQEAFARARLDTIRHYQYVVVQDLLRRLCPKDVWEEAFGGWPKLAAFRYFRPGSSPFIPLEFSLAALRVGHSMVRDGYLLAQRLTARGSTVPLRMPLFHDGSPALGLVGGRTLPHDWSVQWDLFVEHAGSDPQKAMLFDDQLSKPLQALPVDGGPGPRSLALRTLRAGARAGLACGRDVARALGVPPLDDFDGPLWHYLLVESRRAGGRTLGPCAARIIAETVLGLLAADPHSYLNAKPGWKPGPTPGERFGLAELLQRAGAPMTASELG